MRTMKPVMNIVIRTTLTTVVLANALVPTVALAKPETGEAETTEAPAAKNTSYQPSEIYQPPVNTESTINTSSDADDPEPKRPSKDPVEFHVSISREKTGDDRTITVNVVVRNRSGDGIINIGYYDKLNNGVEYGSSADPDVKYNSTTGTITYTADSLGDGEELNFSYSLRVNNIPGKLAIYNTELEYELNGEMIAQTTSFGHAAADGFVEPDSLIIVPDQAGDGWASAGRYSLYLGGEVIPRNVMASITPAEHRENGPALQFDIELIQTAAPAATSDGTLREQEISLIEAVETQFTNPAYLEINLDGYLDLANVPAGQEAYVATYDDTLGIWVKVPIVETDPAFNTVTVAAAHFSTWGVGLGSSLPQNGANVLLFDQPYTSLFTGTSRYSIPIWAPPGRAGMAPSVSLSYSSATVDGVLGDVQAPWTGVGWNIDGIEIVRKITTSKNGYGYVNDFALTLNGAVYSLVTDNTNPGSGRYFTDHDAFLYIERHNYANGNAGVNNVNPQNTTGEWWEVVTTDGTRYRLGWNDDSEQLALMYGYKCSTNSSDCLTPDGAYASLGYAGLANDLVALRWRVDLIRDTHGNTIEYEYFETQPQGATSIAPFDRESYLKRISYTGHPETNLSPAYHIQFEYDERSGIGDVPATFEVWDNVDSKLLNKILVCYQSCAAPGTIVRTYDLDYSLAAVPNANGTLTLASLKVTGGGFTEAGQPIPVVEAPTIRFTYQNKDNRAVSGGDDKYAYPRLVSIDNGAGGLLSYVYETDGRGTNSWYNYRVKEARVQSGVSAAAVQSYQYVTPVYTGAGGNPSLGELIGYTTVTENQLDYSNNNAVILSTAHTFGTKGLDIGRELKTEWSSGGTVHRKVTNVYVTDNSQAPFDRWNFRYLYSTLNYERSNGSLALTTKSLYKRDAANGNLISHIQYLGASVYRKTFYEYLTNPDPSVYILDKASRAVSTDVSNQILSDTRLHYDGRLNEPPTIGDLTLTQRLTGNGDQTVDAAAGYDIYGNVISTETFQNYGALEMPPSGLSYTTSVEFDEALQTYPIQTVDPLGNESFTSYILALGLPYQGTDPNGWTTTTTYDGLGRTLSTYAPGLNQPGVLYAYPQVINGNITAPYSVEMQILDTTANQYRSVWGFYDGLGRMIQTQVYDEDQGKTLVSDSFFNPQGLIARQSLPYYSNSGGGYYLAPSGSQFTESAYDTLGRVISLAQPGGITTTSSYDGLTVTVLDPDGRKVSRTTDGLGRLIQVREYSDDTTIHASTVYSYDIGDRLVEVVDASGNTTGITYDWLGRKTGMQDPDMGDWSYEYDPSGNLVGQMDARGVALTFTYDPLGSLLTKTGSGVSTNFTYGSEPGTIGMRTGMTDASGTTAWTYSNYGRTVTENRQIGSAAHSMTTNTDWLGRPLYVVYPDGDTLTYQYDALGRPSGLDSSVHASLVEVAYNVLGQIASQTYGNGVVIQNSYNAANRLETRSAIGLLNFSYSYDSAGNITQITDGILNETHEYEYDFLNRLTHAKAYSTGDPQDYKYRQGFVYDPLGNMLHMSDWIIPTPQAYREPAPFVDAFASYDGESGNAILPVNHPQQSGSLTFTPTEDAYIVSGYPNTNYGSATTLKVDNSPVEQFLLKFEVSGVGEQEITNAKLRLYNVDAGEGGQFYPAGNNDWQEGSVTWNNAPVAEATLLGSLGTVSQNTWYEVDITSLITGDGIYSLRISSTSNSGADYSSREGSNPPQLVVTLGDPPVATETPSNTPATTSSFLPVGDAYIHGGNPNSNYSSATTLEVDNDPFKHILLKFDVSGIDAQQVVNAKLRLYNTDSSSAGGNFHHVVDNSWYEETVTWNNAPAAEGTLLASLGAVSPGNWYEVDLTSLITGDGIYSLRISSTSTDGADYSSREGSNPPQLVVTLGDPPATGTPSPTPTVPTSGTPPTPTITPVPSNTPAAPSPTPTHWYGVEENTSALLHMDGAEHSTAFIDETGKLWTPLGNVEMDADQYRFGGASAYFDGAGDFLRTASHDDFKFGSGDFTIDMWVRLNTTAGAQTLITKRSSSSAYGPFMLRVNNGQWQLTAGTGTSWNVNIIGGTAVANQWQHVAVVRHGNAWNLYVDGISVASENKSITVVSNTVPVSVGANNDGSNPLNGWVDELRVSKGIARWTENFTPPTMPYGNTPNPTVPPTPSSATSTPQPSATPLVDQSLKAYWSFDILDGTKVPDEAQNDSKDNYASLKNEPGIEGNGASGSAVYFSESNHYATIADDAEIKTSGGFTVSAWVNPASIVTTRTQYIVQKGGAARDYGLITVSDQGTPTPTGPVTVYHDGAIAFQIGDLNPNTLYGPVLPIDTWTMVTGVYDAAAKEMRLYINGELASAQSVTGTLSMSANPLTFSSGSPANVYHGRLDEVRFYNRALTSGEVEGVYNLFTPPAPPVTPTLPPTSTPGATATPLPISQQQWGTGNDGDLEVVTGNLFNINTSKRPGHSCSDAAAYNVTLLGSTAATLNTAPEAGCLNPEDEILLIQLTDSNANTYNAGSYEFLRVASVTGSTVTFTTHKTKWYGKGWRSDSNIGTGSGQIRVMLMRVPNYENVTVHGNGTLTASAFNGNKYGVIAFRVQGELNGSGTITASSRGFNDGAGYGAGATGGQNSGGGGGSYGTKGTNGTWALSGNTYGVVPLDRLFLGSSGGDAGNVEVESGCGPGGSIPCTQYLAGPSGSRGGGIIWIAGQTINFSGTISSNGQGSTTTSTTDINGQTVTSKGSGAGAGGSIRIEGGTVDTVNLTATGGTGSNGAGSGGKGRVAVYSINSTSLASNPAAYTALLGSSITQTPMPTQTPIAFETPAPDFGSGQDGDLIVTGTFNLSTANSNTRTCADGGDGVGYLVSSLTDSTATLSTAVTNGCLLPGDEVLLVRLNGTGANLGAHEFLRVGGVTGDIVYFTTAKTKYYGSTEEMDTAIGKVMLVRVPNYNNVTVNGTLTASAFDGNKYGVIAFRVKGELSGSGTINANSRGFNDGAGYGAGATGGETSGGGGGSYGTKGSNGASAASGNIYGELTLSQFFLGSSGGDAGSVSYTDGCGPGGETPCTNYFAGPQGARGGGGIWISAQTINFADGTITANGENSRNRYQSWDYYGDPLYSQYSGGGAGGGIRIEGDVVTLGTVTANGGAGASKAGGGGKGRIAVYYHTSLTSSLTANTYTHLEQVDLNATPTPTLIPSQTPTITPTSTPAPSGWQIRDYTYDANHPHAVSSLAQDSATVASYVYDENGNMTCRTEDGVTYKQEYNSENRISSIMKLAEGTCENVVKLATKWDFAYDGDAVRVATLTTPYDGNGAPQTASWTAYYFGGAYEVRSDSTTIKYYSFAGQMVAMDDGTGLQYFLSDHLGSVVATTDSTGTLTSQQRYLPFGGVRPNVPSPDAPATDFGYTGQRNLDSGIGLMDYKARFYSPYINRFIQPDTIVPNPSNPQDYNRYSYVLNRPIILNDPTGHCAGLIVCGLTALGILPDFQGIANVILWTRTDNAVVAAGIAVQSQFITGILFGSGHGLAQLTSDDMKNFDGKSPYSPSVAVKGMEKRIQSALNACTACMTETDNLIVAALAQNGFDTRFLPTKNGIIDWELVFSEWGDTDDPYAKIRQDLTGMKFGTRFMTKIYMQDLKILMSLGYDLPENFDDADFDLIDAYVNPPSNPSGASAPNISSGNGFGFNGLMRNMLMLAY